MSNKETTTDDETKLLNSFDSEFNPLVEIGQRIGAEHLDVVMEVLGGQKPHIPMHHNFYAGLEREQRDQKMRDQFTGDNYGQLSMDFNLSLRQTRIIIDKNRREYKRSNELMKPIKATEKVYGGVKQLAEQHHIPMHLVLTHIYEWVTKVHQDDFFEMLKDEYGEQLTMITDEAA